MTNAASAMDVSPCCHRGLRPVSSTPSRKKRISREASLYPALSSVWGFRPPSSHRPLPIRSTAQSCFVSPGAGRPPPYASCPRGLHSTHHTLAPEPRCRSGNCPMRASLNLERQPIGRLVRGRTATRKRIEPSFIAERACPASLWSRVRRTSKSRRNLRLRALDPCVPDRVQPNPQQGRRNCRVISSIREGPVRCTRRVRLGRRLSARGARGLRIQPRYQLHELRLPQRLPETGRTLSAPTASRRCATDDRDLPDLIRHDRKTKTPKNRNDARP